MMVCKHCEAAITSMPVVMIICPTDIQWNQDSRALIDANQGRFMLGGSSIEVKATMPNNTELISFHPECWQEIAGKKYMPYGANPSDKTWL